MSDLKEAKGFDFYEYAGILIPGAIFLLGFYFLYLDPRYAPPLTSMTLAGLAVMAVVAYVAGHLVQAAGNVLEWAWWKVWRGWPTDWVRTGRHRKLISSEQLSALENKVNERLGLPTPIKISELTVEGWRGLTRQIYAKVSKNGNSTRRLEVFNGNYGLNRGISVSMFIVGILSALDGARWTEAVIAAAIIAVIRMHRFGKHYARELFVQFLDL